MLTKYVNANAVYVNEKVSKTLHKRLKGRTEEVYSHYYTTTDFGVVNGVTFFLKSTLGYDALLHVNSFGQYTYEVVRT